MPSCCQHVPRTPGLGHRQPQCLPGGLHVPCPLLLCLNRSRLLSCSFLTWSLLCASLPPAWHPWSSFPLLPPSQAPNPQPCQPDRGHKAGGCGACCSLSLVPVLSAVSLAVWKGLSAGCKVRVHLCLASSLKHWGVPNTSSLLLPPATSFKLYFLGCVESWVSGALN